MLLNPQLPQETLIPYPIDPQPETLKYKALTRKRPDLVLTLNPQP
jgi:hypothetical protein